MKKAGQKALAVLLCVCMVFSCMTISASALTIEAVLAVLSGISTVFGAVEQLGKLYGVEPNVIMDSINADIFAGKGTYLWCAPSSFVNSASTRIETTATALQCIASDWNQNYDGADFDFPCTTTQIRGTDGKMYTVIRLLPNGAYADDSGRSSRIWLLCDGSGRVLCSSEVPDTAGRWVSIKNLKSPYNIVSLESLYTIAKGEGGTVRKSGDKYLIMNTMGTQFLASVDGMAYAAWVNDSQAAINQDRPLSSGTVVEGDTITNNTTTNNYISNEYIDEGDTFYTYDTTNNTYNTTNETYETIINNIEEGDTYYIKEGDTYYEIVIDNSQHIDIENMTQVLPGGVLNQIDSIIYDENNKTYYVDSHDLSLTQNYYYTYQYHINYTSITYIGQTEEYEKNYELYYQLPDGRDSADLTAADLEQLSTSFKDVMNYARSADDLSQRALYHFDGNTEDSSYWSYCSSFDWAKGASLTYMDEGVFGGSLYLDETEHDFTLTLPANDAAGDFTLQFRYYQSYTATPATDSYITIGDVKVLQFDGAQYYNGSGTAITATSIGSWNELCLMRKDGVLYYYINGVPYSSESVSIGTSEVRFYFGSTQQTYKKLDELRFTRGAIYEAGKGYTPTSVPFDSNLSLILPDGKQPLADEVMVFHPSSNNLFSAVGLSDWTDSSVVTNLGSIGLVGFNGGYVADVERPFSKIGLFYNSSYSTLVPSDGYVSLTCSGTTASTNASKGDTFLNGLFLPLCSYGRDKVDGEWEYYGNTQNYTPNTDWTLSVVLDDGSFSYTTFRIVNGGYSYSGSYKGSIISSNVSSVISINLVDMSYGSSTLGSMIYFYGLQIVPSAGSTANIMHIEIAEGSSPEWSISYEGAVYDPGELTESPILAVRSNTPISTYQIGGVRPSYPQKGQVYAMVEGGYITSLQQYTGYAWESVDGRIWTGSRWIPASSYNVITLQDMYDIVDATPDYEYIYTESGFWDWFQRAWKDLISRLDKIIDGMGSGSSVGTLDPEDNTMLPSVEDDPETEGDEGWGAFDLLIVIKDGTWSLITGVISTGFNGLVGLAQGFSHVTGFFNAYDGDSSANVLGITNYGGSDIWD